MTVPATSRAAEGQAERTAMPIASSIDEPINTFSMPQRRASRAASGENRANASIGKAVTRPTNDPETPKSSRIMPTTGPTATSGVRRFRARITTAPIRSGNEIATADGTGAEAVCAAFGAGGATGSEAGSGGEGAVIVRGGQHASVEKYRAMSCPRVLRLQFGIRRCGGLGMIRTGRAGRHALLWRL